LLVLYCVSFKVALEITVEDLQQVLGMTADIYRRVAPDLSVYSLTATLPATTDERLTKIVRDARFDPPPLLLHRG
jgi:hypothetical protein